jgi:hypothetical protein
MSGLLARLGVTREACPVAEHVVPRMDGYQVLLRELKERTDCAPPSRVGRQ